MQRMENVIQAITKATEEKRRRALRWYARQPTEVQIEIVKRSVDTYYIYREQYPNHRNEVRYASLLKAILDEYQSTHQVRSLTRRKNPDHNLDIYGQATKTLIQRFIEKSKRKRKPQKKKQRILDLWDEITRMKEQGLGWPAIAEFLQKHRRIKVHYTYLWRLYRELS